MSDFKFIKNGNWGDYLLVETDRLAETVSFIRDNHVKNIELNLYHGYKLNDITFLIKLDDIIEGLNIIQGDIDLTGIEELTNLKRLNISDDKNLPIDFSSFKFLEKCSILWNKNIKSLSTCKRLKELLIKKINLQDRNTVEQLKGLDNIEKLTLIQSKFDNIDYLEFIPQLKELEIYYSPTLKNINGLRFCLKTIEKLVFDHCRNIDDYQMIGNLFGLKYLGINNGGKIPSLNFIRSLKNLKHLSFVGTVVLDGDINYCIGIDYVGFDNKKHYSHKMEEIRKN
jgi:hypothetical protein